MKKFFRMALVFALAGATLMYTGCTKDYDEDINNLKSEITSLQSSHAADVAALQSSINSLESAYKSADAAIKDLVGVNTTAISNLKTSLGTAEADIKDLKTKVAALETALANTNAALADAKTELQNEIATKISALKAELEGKISTLDAKVDAVKTELITYTDSKYTDAISKLNAAKSDLEAAIAVLNKELRSLVFVPDFYYGGIEADDYTWAEINPLQMVAAKGTEGAMAWYPGQVSYTFAKGAEISTEFVKNGKYTLGQLNTINYNLNPSTFDVTKAEWVLDGMDKKYVVRGDDKENVKMQWAPEFNSISAANGIATVKYSIANPELLPTTLYEDAEFVSSFEPILSSIQELENVLVEAGIEEASGKKITWEEFLKYIDVIFTGNADQAKINKQYLEWLQKLDEEDENLQKQIDNLKKYDTAQLNYLRGRVSDLYKHIVSLEKSVAELYVLAQQNYKGVGYVPSVNLTATLADGKTVSSDYSTIVANPEWFNALAFSKDSGYKGDFYSENRSHLFRNAADAVASSQVVPVAYDGGAFDLDFITVHMFNALEQEYETTLDKLQKVYPNLKFDFSLVDYLTGANKTSESAYGKVDGAKFYPMTVDAEGNQIAPATAKNGGISAVGKKPVVLVKLFDGENLVLAGYFKIEIVKEIGEYTITIPSFGTLPYVCETQTVNSTWAQFSSLVIEDLGTTYAQFLTNYEIVNAKGDLTSLNQGSKVNAMVYAMNAKTNKLEETTKLGTIVYGVDASGSTVNDAFVWTIDKAAADAIGAGNTQEVYVRFQSGPYEVVWVKFSVTIAKAATFDFGANKIANEWDGDNVKVNVPVPDAAGSQKVTEFNRLLDHYFISYEPTRTLSADADPVYKTTKYDISTKYAYSFSSKGQMADVTVGETTYSFSVNAQGKLVATPKNAKVSSEIASLSTVDGKTQINYANNTVSKALLNSGLDIYANIFVQVTYGPCNIKAGEFNFNVHFLRPLAVEFNDVDMTDTESSVDGGNVSVASFVKAPIVDWNKQTVAYLNKNAFTANVIKTVDMWKYYEFATLTVDITNAQRNNWDTADASKWAKVSVVTPKAKLALGTLDAKGVFTAAASSVIDITEAKSLNNYYVNYKNDEAFINEFDVKVPVTITYAWGEFSDEVTIHIKKTADHQ